MGLLEVLPRLRHLQRRLTETVADIATPPSSRAGDHRQPRLHTAPAARRRAARAFHARITSPPRSGPGGKAGCGTIPACGTGCSACCRSSRRFSPATGCPPPSSATRCWKAAPTMATGAVSRPARAQRRCPRSDRDARQPTHRDKPAAATPHRHLRATARSRPGGAACWAGGRDRARRDPLLAGAADSASPSRPTNTTRLPPPPRPSPSPERPRWNWPWPTCRCWSPIGSTHLPRPSRGGGQGALCLAAEPALGSRIGARADPGGLHAAED